MKNCKMWAFFPAVIISLFAIDLRADVSTMYWNIEVEQKVTG